MKYIFEVICTMGDHSRSWLFEHEEDAHNKIGKLYDKYGPDLEDNFVLIRRVVL